MTPTNYRLIRDQLRKSIAAAEDEITYCFSRIEVPPIEKLRLATGDDLVVGALVYYDSGNRWVVIEVKNVELKITPYSFVGTDNKWYVIGTSVQGTAYVEKEVIP